VAGRRPLPGGWLDGLRHDAGQRRSGGIPAGAVIALAAVLEGPAGEPAG